MCVQLLKIKSASPYGSKFAFVPCGKCEECRDSMRNQWFFRLRSELDWCYKHDFHIGFFTLTYSEDKIPRVPLHLIGNKDKITSEYYDAAGVLHKRYNPDIAPYCFDRRQVRTFIDNIRKRVFEIVGKSTMRQYDKRVRYMICSEFGSDPNRTQRSHYHGLICFPPEVKPEVMFKMIHDYWSVDDSKRGLVSKGFVFPRDIRGGRDSSGYVHKPFLLSGDISKAAMYAAKYCTKDLFFSESLLPYDIDYLHQDWKNCKCFHIQSKSIGLGLLSQLPNDRLLDILKNGISYVGDNKRRSLPLYLKRKILFNPWYVFEPSSVGEWYYDYEADKWRYSKTKGTHKRLVRREATSFFYRNYEALYNMKKDYYVQLFKDMQRESFWKSRVNASRCTGDFREIADMCVTTSRILSRHNPERLAVGYLSYYGVPYDKAYCVSPAKAWLSRYEKPLFVDNRLANSDESEPWLNNRPPLVNKTYYDSVQETISLVVSSLQWCEGTNYQRRDKSNRIGDFYKHAI